jgi:hypothetical protein
MKTTVIVLVGLMGCFLTSVAGVSGLMIYNGWQSQGGWSEWAFRLSIGYPCSCIVVLLVFPWFIPKASHWIEEGLSQQRFFTQKSDSI